MDFTLPIDLPIYRPIYRPIYLAVLLISFPAANFGTKFCMQNFWFRLTGTFVKLFLTPPPTSLPPQPFTIIMTFAIAIFNIFLRVADSQYFAGSVSVNNHGSGSSI